MTDDPTGPLAPFASPISVQVPTNTDHTVPPVTPGTPITLVGSDPNDPPLPLSYLRLSSPTHGTISGTEPDLTYLPDPDFTGSDNFQYEVSNGVFVSNVAYVSITVGDFGPGTWPETSDKCPCECPLAPVEVGYSERVDVGSGFGDWSDYDFTNILVASNSDPSMGGAETQVRVKIRITCNGVAAVVRFRQVNSFEDDFGKTVFTVGTLQVIAVDLSGVQEVLFDFVPCAIGESAVLVGAPGRANVSLQGKTQIASLKRVGFLAYVSEAGIPKIYKQEEVVFGGDPGCIPDSRPPRDYSGSQVFSTTAAEAPFWIADPAGLYTSTLSDDLIEDNYASKPFGTVAEPDTFGAVTLRETEKDMIENFRCSGVALEKILNLGLSISYLSSEMVLAVDDALSTLEGLDGTIPVEVGDQVAMHRYFLSPGETVYNRIHTTSIRAAALGIDGGEIFSVFANPDGPVNVTVTCTFDVRPFDGTDPAETTETFTARLYGINNLADFFGRPALTPEDAGFPDVPPLVNPWGGLGTQQTEVIVKNVKAKPHSLICHKLLFSEPESVIAEGVDS